MANEREHGHFQFYYPGPDIIWVQAVGAWNAATTKRYVEECKIAISAMRKPVARVADLRHWEYGGPEILDDLTSLYHWMQNQNVVRQIDLVASKLALKMHMQKIETASNFLITVSHDTQVTLETLKEEGWTIYSEFKPPL